jgi:hypothetical protein
MTHRSSASANRANTSMAGASACSACTASANCASKASISSAPASSATCNTGKNQRPCKCRQGSKYPSTSQKVNKPAAQPENAAAYLCCRHYLHFLIPDAFGVALWPFITCTSMYEKACKTCTAFKQADC